MRNDRGGFALCQWHLEDAADSFLTGWSERCAVADAGLERKLGMEHGALFIQQVLAADGREPDGAAQIMRLDAYLKERLPIFLRRQQRAQLGPTDRDAMRAIGRPLKSKPRRRSFLRLREEQ